jgi:hypothetical protein
MHRQRQMALGTDGLELNQWVSMIPRIFMED